VSLSCDDYRTLPRKYRGKLSLINAIADISPSHNAATSKNQQAEAIRAQQTRFNIIPRGTYRMVKINAKAILLDFGGTLAYSHQPTWNKYEKTLLSTLKNHGHTITIDDLRLALDKLYTGNTQGEFKDYTEYWTTFVKQQYMPTRTSLVKDLEAVRKQAIGKLYRLYNRVLPILSELHEKYPLTLVSNCSMGTREEINKLGLAKFFEHMSLSYEVGVRKPDKRIYLDTLKTLTLEGHECIFVADEISDLEGARALKMKTLLVRQGSSTYSAVKDPSFRPDAECRRMSEITRFL
jgi:HAD superfamily hydrolase (TIGR01509 family)